MALSFGKDKNKSTGSQTQQFNQTSTTSLSPRAQAVLTDRMAELRGAEYDTLDPMAYKDYTNPYEDDVVAAVRADIEAGRAGAQNQRRSDWAKGGAFGNGRADIYQAEIDGQYDRTAASTIAALRSRGFSEATGVAAGENANRNNFRQMTQQQINQLLALLADERTTTGSGTSSGTSKGSQTGLNFGASWSPAQGFNA